MFVLTSATYILWNRDDRAGSEKAMTGAQMMAGLRLEGDARTALVYEYCLAAAGRFVHNWQAEWKDRVANSGEWHSDGKAVHYGGYFPESSMNLSHLY